jgi:hypothetical protein
MNPNIKQYQCRECKNDIEDEANHYACIVPFCKVCNKFTYHDFKGVVPEGGWVPESFPQEHVDFLNKQFPGGKFIC